MTRILLTCLLLILPLEAFAGGEGVVSRQSRYPVLETIDRVEAVLQERKITIFARIDHGGEAARAGLQMRPAQLLIFGNPRAGTPLMNAAPTVAIDLPMKVLAWQDEAGKIWLSYNSPDYLKRRHDLPDSLVQNVAVVEALVDAALR